MLRFIDLRGQIDIYDDKPLEEQRIDFAFFDTIHEKFIEINGSQRWTRFEDLAMDINIDLDPGLCARVISLLPAWARRVEVHRAALTGKLEGWTA